MVPQRLELIDRAEVDRLCSDAVAENQTLDFKRELPRKDAKSDLLKDVCAFANADGGDLVYGIADAAGIAKAVSPITGETPDHAMRRLGQVLDAIEPRVRGMQMQPVDMGEGGYCLILRVPASFDAPHRYYSEGGSRSDVFCRFVVRNGTRTMDLTYEQLRTAFDRTATLTDRAARFIEERMDVIRARKT